ncbi:MAG: hypothetical protein H0V29_04180 [Thermoleophilaceae bacterium]|nr:hypothetical protein [Thermoleophilaceae bacterium]
MNKRPIKAAPMVLTTVFEVVLVVLVGVVIGGVFGAPTFLVIGLILPVVWLGSYVIYPAVYDRWEHAQ